MAKALLGISPGASVVGTTYALAVPNAIAEIIAVVNKACFLMFFISSFLPFRI